MDLKEIDESTKLKVLRATEENKKGDGKRTCTLVQKAENYEEVQPDVENLTLAKSREGTYFWKYKEQIKNITFEDSINIPEEAYESWNVSSAGEETGKVMAYIKKISDEPVYYDLYIQGDEYIYANKDSSNLFKDFINVDSINNMYIFNTSNAESMYRMFYRTGRFSEIFTLNLGDNFNTSSVTSMHLMFSWTGYSNPLFKLDCSNWNVENITSYNGFNNGMTNKIKASSKFSS